MADIATARGARRLQAAGAHLPAGYPRRDGGAAQASPADTLVRSRLFDFGTFKPSGEVPIRNGRFGALKFGGTATFKRCDERGLDLTIHAKALKGLIQADVRLAYELLPGGEVVYRSKREDDGPRHGDEPESGDAVMEVVEQRPGRTVLRSPTGKQAILTHDPARGTFTVTYDTFTLAVDTRRPDSGN